MAAMKMVVQSSMQKQSRQSNNTPKKGRGRPQKEHHRIIAIKDENQNVQLPTNSFDKKYDENIVASFPRNTPASNIISSPFAPLNGEQNRRSQRMSKESTPTKSAQMKKRKSTSKSSDSPAKRRKTKKSPETSSASPESKMLTPEEHNWIPIGKPWAEMVSVGSSTTKKAVCCFPAVKHKTENITFNILDVISVAAGEDVVDGDNIGKIDRIFFDKKLGMCANVLWYYKYNQCILKDENKLKVEKKYNFHERELIASKHTDTISCDSIQSHAFALTFSEYCRYIAENKFDRLPSQLQSRCKELCPRGDSNYPRRRYLPHEDTPPELVYFCRKYYSIARKAIYSSAPNQTPAQKRRIMKSRPTARLLQIQCRDSDNAENRNKTPE